MRIAVIGGGISGLTAAHILSREHEVTLYEQNDYVGGHTHTVPVTRGDATYNVDTGFIVFNDRNYPNFERLLAHLGIKSQPTQMSFSVCCERTGLEYGFASLNALFCQRRNLFSPSFLRMLYEIHRFRSEFRHLLAEEGHDEGVSDFLRRRGYSRMFHDHFLVPFGAAIWSAGPDTFRRFPIRTMAQFFSNHGFLNTKTLLPWRVVQGGSSRYIEPLIKPFAARIRTSAPVRRLRRVPSGIEVHTDRDTEVFDQAVVGAHSDEALAMLDSPTPAEQALLGAIPYQPNDTVLHTDSSVLPEHRNVWSSWNYRVPRDPGEHVTVTYDMNILQSLNAPVEFCVTLNMTHAVAPEAIIGRYCCHHPVYRPEGIEAQHRHADISGVDRIHYCGAYWGYGFHEDGVVSALRVTRAFGLDLPQ